MSKLISWNEWIGSRYYSNNRVYKSNQINLLKKFNSKICLICRGGKLLCGKINLLVFTGERGSKVPNPYTMEAFPSF